MARLWRFDISNHQKWKIWVSRSYISDWSWQLWFFLSKIDREFSLFFLKLPSSLKPNKMKLKRILTYFSIVEKIGRKKPCQVRCLLWFTTCGERFLGISRTFFEGEQAIGNGSLSFFLIQVNNYEIVVKKFPCQPKLDMIFNNCT